jgi:tetratricopeptide (TPR) repeat protein
VSIPASTPNQITALVMVSADDKSATSLLERLHAAMASTKNMQTIVLCSGPGADQRSSELAKQTPWPVVADKNHEAVEALGVRGWPMVLVLRPDGLEVTRVSGDATFLAMKIPAYLDRAAGRIDEKALQQQLATLPVVEGDAGKRIARDLRVARVLLDESRPQQALAFLDRDAKALAGTPQSKALRAEALIQLKKPDDALSILDQIPSNDVLKPGQIELLRAQAFVVQERWYLAKPLLESALDKSPDLVQAHRLLGQVYEQEQNWAKAAEHYRAASDAAKAR